MHREAEETLKGLQEVYPNFVSSTSGNYFVSDDLQEVSERNGVYYAKVYDAVYPIDNIQTQVYGYMSFEEVKDFLKKNKEQVVSDFHNIKDIYEKLKTALGNEGYDGAKTIKRYAIIRRDSLTYHYGSVEVFYKGDADTVVKKFINRLKFEEEDRK